MSVPSRFKDQSYLVEELVELLLALSNGVLDLSDETRVRLGGRSGLNGVGDLGEGALLMSQSYARGLVARTETTEVIWPKTFFAVSAAFSEVEAEDPATGKPVAGSISRVCVAGAVPYLLAVCNVDHSNSPPSSGRTPRPWWPQRRCMAWWSSGPSRQSAISHHHQYARG